jgi:hypothetical protein
MTKLFDPRRDINEECGYPTTFSDEQYRAMYDRELGARVVNIFPEETWKLMPKIYEDADPDTETAFEAALEEFEGRMHLLTRLQRADELSGVGQYGVILWGLDDGKTLTEGVEGFELWGEATGASVGTPTKSSHRVLFMRIMDASLVRISAYETDHTNPRFGLPIQYNLTLADPRTQEAGATVTMPDTTETSVHWSRITHLADNRKTSEVLGVPRMQTVWNRLYDLRKILGGNGEMFWRGGFPGLSLETQPGLENAQLDEEATRAMMADYMNGMQRYLALTGMTAKSLSPQIADPTQSFDVQVKAICITLGVPYRVFMGIEEGVVSGDQATKAWDSRLVNRQHRYVTPMVIDPAIQRLIDYGQLPPPLERWTVEWPDLSSPSELDKAEVASKKTEAFAKYVAGGVDVLIPPMEYLTLVCGLDDKVATAIMEAAVGHIEDIDDDDTVTPGRLPVPEELELLPGEEEPEELPAAKEEPKPAAKKPKVK